MLRAASRHEEIDARLGLNDASSVLDAFYGPAVARALRQQAGTIRNGLADEGARPEPGLWRPLEAELGQALFEAPAEHREQARQAVRAGHASATKGDRKGAEQQLDVLEDVLDCRWGLLPVRKLRGDLHSAEMALNADPPYWKGITEAMRSALAAVRWVTTSDATGWLSAYESAVDARYRLPANAAGARSALKQAAEDLEGVANAEFLAKEVRKLAEQANPELKSVENLIRGLRSELPGTGTGS